MIYLWMCFYGISVANGSPTTQNLKRYAVDCQDSSNGMTEYYYLMK